MHVVEHPALEPLLEEWAAAAVENEKEAAEKKIDDIFDDVDVKVLFIQVGDSQGDQMSGIVKEWNRGRSNKGEWDCFFDLCFQFTMKIFCNNKCSSQFSSSPPTQQQVTTTGATDTWRQTDNHSPASKSGS